MRSLIAGLFLSLPAVAMSQQAASTPSATAPTRATISGVAVDSVRGGYLRGAIVSVSGTALSAMTGATGRFRIDSVPPGTRYLQLMHPLLDSLSITVRSPQRSLIGGETTSFILSVPSPRTVVATKCTIEERQRGTGAVFGTVNDADTDTPAAGAEVVVEWTEYQLARRSVNKLPQRRVGTVRADGTYRVCGIPDDLVTTAMAIRGADSTGTITVSFENQLSVASFHLPNTVVVPPSGAPTNPQPAAQSAASNAATDPRSGRGTAVLTGKVTDASGSPLANARVAVESDEAAAPTDNQGRFRLSGLRTGTRSLSVRRIGFASVDMPVDLSAVSPRDVTVTMSRYVATLDVVRVTAIREIGLQRVGFSERKRTGAGKFYSPEDIAQRNPQRLLTLLEVSPLLRMGTNADGKRYVTGRHNGCVGYYVDGFRWFSTNPTDVEMSPDGFISGAELGAVEVYDDLSAPGEYMRISNTGAPCAVVVIWTKRKLGT